MGDAGEGLVDAEARIFERMEELEEARARKRDPGAPVDSEALRAVESLRLARVEIERQLADTAHERRRAVLEQALADVDRRLAEARARLG